MRMKTKLIPVNGYDMAALRAWLEQMADGGLQYVFAVGPFIQFRKTQKRQVRLHLEPVRKGTNREEKDLSELYTEAGWSFWGNFKDVFYIFAAEADDAVSHTEPEVLEYALKRLCSQLRRRCLGVTVALALLGWFVWEEFFDFFRSFDFRFAPLHTIVTTGKSYWMLPLLPALILLLIAMVRGLPKIYGLIYALHSGEKMEAPRIKGGGWLKAAWCCLLLVPVFWGFQTRYVDSLPLDELNASCGYVRLEELETAPGFSTSSALPREWAGQRSHILIPLQYNSQEWGGYNVTEQSQSLENGVTMTTYSPRQYYLKTQFLRCLTTGIAEHVFREQDHWAYFIEGTPMTYPGFDELIVNLERGGESMELAELTGELSLRVGDSKTDVSLDLTTEDMNRWNLYAREGKNVLFVEYRGSGDLRDFLPRFAEMIQTLGD